MYNGNATLGPQVLVENIEAFRVALANANADGTVGNFLPAGNAMLGADIGAVKFLVMMRAPLYFASDVLPENASPNILDDFIVAGDVAGDMDLTMRLTASRDLIRRFGFVAYRRNRN